MIAISYGTMVAFISAIWLLVRGYFAIRTRAVCWKREAQLLLVYICLIVVVRFTFCPFGKVDGQIQPLLFDPAQMFPPRINLVPLKYLLDYLIMGEAVLNTVGNTAMFIPIGIIWPAVFKRLDSHKKVIAAGVGFSLCIEILQLPFLDRVTDIDDLILNSLGFLMGYGIFLLMKKCRKK
ncbi:MAG: VanZ family protein [Oscillospiraceae bacterium]|nr:VanZ family protein [Oscillospiraceae bacterium]MBQ7130453.1 VanZ family protein [Oscillospiraceae bacterium]